MLGLLLSKQACSLVSLWKEASVLNLSDGWLHDVVKGHSRFQRTKDAVKLGPGKVDELQSWIFVC